MASNPTATGAADIFEKWAPQREKIAYALIGLGIGLAAIPVANLALYGWQSLLFFAWGVGVSLTALIVGVVYLTLPPAPSLRDEADRLRITLLVVLGLLGLLTALLGLALPFASPPFSLTDYRDIFKGGVRKWRERANALALTWCGAALIGGLVLMFVGLLQARTFERTRPGLRRLLYGYNAVLSSLLLVLIFILLNLLPYAGVWPFSYANESIDYTRTGLYSLHQATKSALAELKQPVKVYALGSSSDQLMKDVTNLLDRCRAVNPRQFSWEQLSRDRNLTDLRELMAKYKVPDAEGVLLVYGTDPDTTTDFIRFNDLFESPSARQGGNARYRFKGENALLNSLIYLSAEKKRANVYFTQGSGELSYSERAANRVDSGIGKLIDDLGRVNYEAHELKVAVDTDKVPDDADIVVVARPMQPMPAKFVKALRDYLHGTGRKDSKKGKLVVLFDVVTEADKGKMVRTGLEDVVGEYGVRVNDNQLLDLDPDQDYLLLKGIADIRSNNPIAKAFANESAGTLSLFRFYKARSLESSKANPPGAPPSGGPDNLVITLPRQPILPQTDLNAGGGALIAELRRDPQKVMQRISRTPLALAMTVTEGKGPAPIPGHEFMAPEGQPRLVVFGDASWVSNELLRQNNFNLFVSCLSWLAERSDIGARVPPTEHDVYVFRPSPGSGLRLLLLPGFLLMLGVFVLGMGVWVVRRR
ncbi:MAG TPA: Gldg family protein [Gemmataceae bacterium]|jgi:hypothetical protein